MDKYNIYTNRLEKAIETHEFHKDKLVALKLEYKEDTSAAKKHYNIALKRYDSTVKDAKRLVDILAKKLKELADPIAEVEQEIEELIKE